MKLKTKLLLGGCGIFIIAFALCAVLLLRGSVAGVNAALMDSADAEREMLQSHLQSSFASANEELSLLAQRSRAAYIFRNLSPREENVWYVLNCGSDVIQNNFGYTLPVSNGSDIVSIADEWYSISCGDCTLGAQVYTVGIVRRVTETITSLWQRVLFCSAGCLLLMLCAIGAIGVLLRRTLRPIEALKEGAQAVANGDYGKRLPVRTQDELGALSESFNAMASAVQTHLERVETTAREQALLLRALAHETRTPVTAISGYAHALRHARLSEEEQQEAAEFLERESLRLERLTTKLTELITLENAVIHRERIAAEVFAHELSQLFIPLARQRGVVLDVAAQGNLTGDRDLLASVLINLFDNACKAGAKEIHISIAPSALTMTDNGKGIPAAALPHVTQAFYQVDTARHEGFGLGLALCQRIAELHSGALHIESTEGRGTTVILTM